MTTIVQMLYRSIRIGTLVIPLSLPMNPARSQQVPVYTGGILDGLGVINFDSNSKFAIGDTVSIRSMNAPRERCLIYDPQKDIRNDTEGAVRSQLRLYLVNTYEDFEKEFSFSFSLQASMGANFGNVFGGNVSSTTSGQVDQFLNREKHSLLVILEAQADHGREVINEFSIKQDYKPLLNAANKDEFIQRCGTHFIRGVVKKSALRVVFNVDSLNETTKTVIVSKFAGSASGKGGIQAVSAEAKASFSTDLSQTLKLATKFGKISYEVQGVGGEGIGSLAKTLKGANLSAEADVKAIVDAFASAAAEYTLKNAAPDRFIIVPHPQLVPTDIKFDAGRYEQLGKIYKALLRVDEQVSIYNSYKTKNPILFDKYFAIYAQKFSDLRSDLLSKYSNCRDRNECDVRVPLKVDGITLDDIVYDGEITADCPLGNELKQRLNPLNSKTTQFISSIVLGWAGHIRYLDDIDISGVQIYRISPDLEMSRLPFSIQRQWRTRAQEDGKVAAFVTISRTDIDSATAVKDQSVDLNYLDSVRTDVARSRFLFRFPTAGGISVDDVIGYPDMKGCKLIDENL
jgi:hypothetical protein